MAEIWSIPTWLFFHTVAEKINEDFLNLHKSQVIRIIKLICNNLPCPECRTHATRYCRNLTAEKIKSKQDLIDFFYIFHNSVNSRLGKSTWARKSLEKYKRGRLDIIYTKFLYGFMKKYSRTLYAGNLSQDAKRRRTGKLIDVWVQTHWTSLQGFSS